MNKLYTMLLMAMCLGAPQVMGQRAPHATLQVTSTTANVSQKSNTLVVDVNLQGKSGNTYYWMSENVNVNDEIRVSRDVRIGNQFLSTTPIAEIKINRIETVGDSIRYYYTTTIHSPATCAQSRDYFTSEVDAGAPVNMGSLKLTDEFEYNILERDCNDFSYCVDYRPSTGGAYISYYDYYIGSNYVSVQQPSFDKYIFEEEETRDKRKNLTDGMGNVFAEVDLADALAVHAMSEHTQAKYYRADQDDHIATSILDLTNGGWQVNAGDKTYNHNQGIVLDDLNNITNLNECDELKYYAHVVNEPTSPIVQFASMLGVSVAELQQCVNDANIGNYESLKNLLTPIYKKSEPNATDEEVSAALDKYLPSMLEQLNAEPEGKTSSMFTGIVSTQAAKLTLGLNTNDEMTVNNGGDNDGYVNTVPTAFDDGGVYSVYVVSLDLTVDMTKGLNLAGDDEKEEYPVGYDAENDKDIMAEFEIPNYRIWRVDAKGNETLVDGTAIVENGGEKWESTRTLSPDRKHLVVRDVFKGPALEWGGSATYKYIARVYPYEERNGGAVAAPSRVGNKAAVVPAGSWYIKEKTMELKFDRAITTAASSVEQAREVASVTYYNAMGVAQTSAHDGFNIVVTRYTDGTTSTSKMTK